VDGNYSFTGVADTWFSASLFDAGGLYRGSNSRSLFLPDTTVDRPGGFYAAVILICCLDSQRSTLPEPPVLERAVSRKSHGAPAPSTWNCQPRPVRC
jgi:hypothetical protein